MKEYPFSINIDGEIRHGKFRFLLYGEPGATGMSGVITSWEENMGSDLAMNPPAHPQWRAKWDWDILIVEQKLDPIAKGYQGPGFHEIYRENDPEKIKIIDEFLEKTHLFKIPPQPKPTAEQVVERAKLAKWRKQREEGGPDGLQQLYGWDEQDTINALREAGMLDG